MVGFEELILCSPAIGRKKNIIKYVSPMKEESNNSNKVWAQLTSNHQKHFVTVSMLFLFN